MATVDASPIVYELTTELRALQQAPQVEAVFSELVEDTFVVWVGIREDNAIARKMAYYLEDLMSVKFPDVIFDFHVIALPEDKNTRDYVTNAQVVFQRSA